MSRRDRAFRVYVVEPDDYQPAQHRLIFNAALTALLTPRVAELDPFVASQERSPPELFDLITFPEAFLASEDLLGALELLRPGLEIGCIHVGLRRDIGENHLFSPTQLTELISAIAELNVCKDDLAPFSNWLRQQHPSSLFNIGCLFTLDSEGRIRICLHPKSIRSKFEVSALPEDTMCEGNLLSVITLYPENKALKTVTIQPLLCSDLLESATVSGNPGAFFALRDHADALGDEPPDHIDIVSVPTCTPSLEKPAKNKGGSQFSWHPEFRNTFSRIGRRDIFSRHHFASLVLANFRNTPDATPGGLSGVFLPVSMSNLHYQEFIAVSCFGLRADEHEHGWSQGDENPPSTEIWKSRGYLVCLDRSEDPTTPTGRLFNFTVQPLPRENAPWGSPAVIAGCRVQNGRAPGPDQIVFGGV